MKTLSGNKIARVLAMSATLLIVFTSMLFAAQPTTKSTAVVFSFAYIGMQNDLATGNTSRSTAAQSAIDVCSLLNDGLVTHKHISAIKFEPRLAAIQRAVREQRFTEKQVAEPIDTTPSGAARAQKLASLIGAEIAIIGSVDRFHFDQKSKTAELTCTVQIVDVSTGKVSEMLTATGRSTAPADSAQVDMAAMGTAASYDAAEKLLADMVKIDPTNRIGEDGTIQSSSPVTMEQGKRKSHLPAILGAVLLGFLLSGG